MGRKETDKQINFSMGEDLYNQIREAASERGLSVAAFLKAAAQDAVLDDLKAAVPDQSSNIDSFKSKLGELSDLYKIALTQAADSYEIASSQVKEELKGLQDLTRMTQEQSDTISELRDDNETLRTDLAAAKQSIEDQEELKKEIQKLSDENLQLRKEVTEMNESWAAEKRAHADEIQKLQAESFDKLLQIVRAKS